MRFLRYFSYRTIVQFRSTLHRLWHQIKNCFVKQVTTLQLARTQACVHPVQVCGGGKIVFQKNTFGPIINENGWSILKKIGLKTCQNFLLGKVQFEAVKMTTTRSHSCALSQSESYNSTASSQVQESSFSYQLLDWMDH